MSTSSEFDTSIMDHADGYGLVSRFFHWLVVLLLLYQVVSALAHHWFEKTAIGEALFSQHFLVGSFVLIVTALRILWALVNIPKRPAHGEGLDKLAVYGHLALYTLLIVVPSLAILRDYGAGRGWSVLGLQILPRIDHPIVWLTTLGNALHGELGYVLFAIVVGHSSMAIIHDTIFKERMVERMTTGRGKA